MLDLDNKIDFKSLTDATDLLDDDPEEPKSLEEIYQEVGKFPFTAKAVVYPDLIVTSIVLPVGEVVTIIKRDFTDKDYFLEDGSRKERNNICGYIKRWVLVKEVNNG